VTTITFYRDRRHVDHYWNAPCGRKRVAGRRARGVGGGMDLDRFDPATDPGAVRACHDIHLLAARADNQRRPPMSPRVFRSWLTHGWTEDPQESWLARDEAGQARGFCLLTLPERENRHMAELSPVVHPARRRAGLGTALVAHAAARAREAGRTVLMAHPAEASAGEAFARALGARYRMTGLFPVLRLDSVPAGHLATLRAKAESASPGYSLLTWDGATPGDQLGAVVGLFQAEEDAPRPAGEETEQWDAARVRADERRVADQGLRFYTVAARTDPGGQLVAITQLGVDPAQPGWAVQELTAVIRPHRGRRLGLRVKVAMLDLLARREPQVTRILTHNVEGNEHMIAINAELGFEVLERETSWELDVADAPQHLAAQS
jgi:GNAT superfamily N-acetyltransferase